MAVQDILDRIKIIHAKKAQDYSAPENRFENFERAAYISWWFKNSEDKTFATLIGVKLARLATLLGSDKEPENESIADNLLDLSTYCILWTDYHEDVAKIDQEISQKVNQGKPIPLVPDNAPATRRCLIGEEIAAGIKHTTQTGTFWVCQCAFCKRAEP